MQMRCRSSGGTIKRFECLQSIALCALFSNSFSQRHTCRSAQCLIRMAKSTCPFLSAWSAAVKPLQSLQSTCAPSDRRQVASAHWRAFDIGAGVMPWRSCNKRPWCWRRIECVLSDPRGAQKRVILMIVTMLWSLSKAHRHPVRSCKTICSRPIH